ncbi:MULTISPECIES: tetratricopeptide repeat protein [unclassified Guyparkeria]|uniref:tetratricopeptide repeat protein n=1 Tax=unclassified Guyparkeria TaxID=2626246 RepID=UPI000826C578|nr:MULTISPECIES: tetratricopeptide repeat protein [unclassified Guyparkeria]
MNTTALVAGAAWRRPFLSIAVAGMLLAGCAPMPTRQTPPPQPAPEPEPTVRATPLQEPTLREEQLPSEPESAPQPSRTSPAVLALVRQAEQRRNAGDLAGAQSTLERAVQIEPTNARLWLDLAQVRLAQGQPAQAEQLALRAVEHARDNRTLSAAWSLVAKARRAQGDEDGAREAEERAGAQSAAVTSVRAQA